MGKIQKKINWSDRRRLKYKAGKKKERSTIFGGKGAGVWSCLIKGLSGGEFLTGTGSETCNDGGIVHETHRFEKAGQQANSSATPERGGNSLNKRTGGNLPGNSTTTSATERGERSVEDIVYPEKTPAQ